MHILWKDDGDNCKCESCGKIVPEDQLNWENDLGYCPECYREMKEHDALESQPSS